MTTASQPIERPTGSSAAPAIILPHGGYRNLIVFRKSDVIYQGTCVFCRRFLPPRGDRTVDQMVQGARSCKQNIAEGSAASGTSRETEIKLTNVARASLVELREDYLDYLTAHGESDWPATDPRKAAMRRWTADRNDWRDYAQVFAERPAAVLCNLQLVLIGQARLLLERLLKSQEDDFRRQGGVRERMHAARTVARAQGWETAMWSFLTSAVDGSQLADREAAVIGEVRQIVARQRRKMGW